MTIDEIEQAIHVRGVRIITCATPPECWAAYSHKYQAVIISPNLTQHQRRAALMHELIHIERGDDGHQPEHIERRINRQTAQRLIRALDYARAEKMHSGNVSGIAIELEVPVWVVESYKDYLRARSYK